MLSNHSRQAWETLWKCLGLNPGNPLAIAPALLVSDCGEGRVGHRTGMACEHHWVCLPKRPKKVPGAVGTTSFQGHEMRVDTLPHWRHPACVLLGPCGLCPPAPPPSCFQNLLPFPHWARPAPQCSLGSVLCPGQPRAPPPGSRQVWPSVGLTLLPVTGWGEG